MEPILQLHEEMIRAIGRFDGQIHRNSKDRPLLPYRHRLLATCQRGKSASTDSLMTPLRSISSGNQKQNSRACWNIIFFFFRYQIHADSGSVILQNNSARRRPDRIRTFRETHAVFIQYYEEARTDWDAHYFLRRKFHKVQRPRAQVYDRATDFWTNGDWILTLLYANRRFEQFLGNAKTSV